MRILILGKVWPEPASTAAGRRTSDLLGASLSVTRDLHFASGARQNDYSMDLKSRGVETHSVQPNDSGFDHWIEKLKPDVVIFDRFMIEEQYGWRVERVCPDAVRILDTSDLHCLREARHEALKSGEALDLLNDIALREIASIHRCDCTLMISEYEYDLLCRDFLIPEEQLFYWPFLSDGLKEIMKLNYEERSNFVMIGSLMHPPNLDSVRWCRDVIWPLILKEQPDAELHCYGSYGERFASELTRADQGFYFKGRADSAVETVAQYRVNLAPLRFGAGLKGKLFDGFETGTPCVTTPIGAEGIALEAEWGCAISAAPIEFASTASAVYQNPRLWQSLVDSGAAILESRFSRDYWKTCFQKRLHALIESRDDRRHRQFTGRMLRYHQHRSTEFMSRWIEEKNRA